jgi:hypothetical protein
MDELNKSYNLIPIDIKNDETLKSKIKSLINAKDTFNITLNEKEPNELNIKSLKKIFKLSNQNIEDFTFFLIGNKAFHQSDEITINNPVSNEIGTSYNKDLPKMKAIIETDPLIKKIDLFLPYIYLIIGTISLIHLLIFLFGPEFEINVYVFTSLVLSEGLLSLGYFYYEKYHYVDSYIYHEKFIPYFLIAADVICIFNILLILLTKNPMLITYRKKNKIICFISYFFSSIISCVGSYYEFIFIKKRRIYHPLQEVNDVKNDISIKQETQEVKIA